MVEPAFDAVEFCRARDELGRATAVLGGAGELLPTVFGSGKLGVTGELAPI